MRKFVQQVLPPIILNGFRAFRRSHASRLYKTYDNANAACEKGYELEELTKVVVEKNLIYKQQLKSTIPLFDLSTLRTLIGLGLATRKESLNVLDFGGGGGYHYTIAKAVLGSGSNLKWNVVETKAMAKEGIRMANDQLKFFDNIADAKNDLGSVDLVFTSSALQYCPDPLYYLKCLTEIGAKNIFITRTPFNDLNKSIISIQTSMLSSNGPGPLPKGFTDRRLDYPISYVSKAKIEKILCDKYDIGFIIDEGKSDFLTNMYGYFCVLKTD